MNSKDKIQPLLVWIISLGVMVALGCTRTLERSETRETTSVDYVNPYMGNISHLLVPTFPTVHMPNSMLRVYPERSDFTEDNLMGLPLIITSHRGSSAFNLSAFQGPQTELAPVKYYSYDNEQLTPYSYYVYLDNDGIAVNFGLSHQAAQYRLDFENGDEVQLVLNSKAGAVQWDGKGLFGYQNIGNGTKVYIYLVPDKEPQHAFALPGAESGNEAALETVGGNAAMVLNFAKGVKTIHLNYGISFISADQAKRNMERELSGKRIDDLHREGREKWNEALGKIEVDGGSEDDLAIFYTSLYRCYERPVNISEDGRYYSAFDGKVHSDNGRSFFTDDWIWDSYRAHHPLRVLIDPKKEEDIVHSFVQMSEQMDHFWLPTFPEITGDSRRMNSNHGVATIIDAYRKGLTDFNLEKAYGAARGAITEKTLAPWSGKPGGWLDTFYKDHGYIPALYPGEKDTVSEVNAFEKRQPVAVTLGTAYDAWCLAQIAKELGKEDEHDRFLKASYNYRNLFNPDTQFFHPKDKDGHFIEPFDYRYSGGMGAREYYGENNGWTYRWDVQHNVADLVHLMGGRASFIRNLEAMFSEPLGKGKFEFYAQLPDHTGNVGQFSMANEPSLHIPYLYNYAGQPWKTQKRIRTLLRTWFRNDLMGVPGDEDGGGMSAFVVFSMLGFYPVTPGIPVYNIGSPIFENAVVHLPEGKDFEIKVHNYGADHKYIQSAKLNGMDWDKPWFSHEDIKDGGTLELYMGHKANKQWGSAHGNEPPSAE